MLEPGRWRLQQPEIAPLYSSLGNRVRLYLKKKKQKDRNEEGTFQRFKLLLEWTNWRSRAMRQNVEKEE